MARPSSLKTMICKRKQTYIKERIFHVNGFPNIKMHDNNSVIVIKTATQKRSRHL